MPITANFGTPQYTVDAITIAVTTSESVLSLHATDFRFVRVNGDAIDDWQPFLEGSGTGYSLIVPIPKGRHGAASIGLNGNVIKRSNLTDDTITASAFVLPYDTRKPTLVDKTIPAKVYPGVWDIYLDFNVPITGLSLSDFEQDGANLDTPKLYQSQIDTPASKRTTDVSTRIASTQSNLDTGNVSIAGTVAATAAYTLELGTYTLTGGSSPGLEVATLSFGGTAIKIADGQGTGDINFAVTLNAQSAAATPTLYKKDSLPANATDGTLVAWDTAPIATGSDNGYSVARVQINDAPIGTYYWIVPSQATNITDASVAIEYDFYETLPPLDATTDLKATIGNWTAVPNSGNTAEAKYFLLRYVNPARRSKETGD